jgi:DnaK suppressor protein
MDVQHRERTGSRFAARKRSSRLENHLPSLRKALEEHRDFRVEQLAELAHDRTASARDREAGASAAAREVASLIAAGAWQALADIERALGAMDAGTYGSCAGCASEIPLAILLAVPRTTLCLACRQPTAGSASTSPAAGPGLRRDTVPFGIGASGGE